METGLPNLPTPTQKKRLVWLDLLRILASLMIITLNLITPQLDKISVGTTSWQIINANVSAVRAATPLFVMVSGVLFLDIRKEMPLKKLFGVPIRKIVVIYLVWSCIYAVFTILTSDSLASTYLFRDLVTLIITSHYHLWFLPILISLYILSPFLRVLIKSGGKPVLTYAITLFFLGIVVQTLLSSGDLLPNYQWLSLLAGKFPFGTIFLFAGYFLLGYSLVYVFELSRNKTCILYALGIVGVFAAAFLTSRVSLRAGMSDQRLSDRLSLMTLFEVVALFLFFKNTVGNMHFSRAAENKIAGVSRLTLGVFLIHPIVIYFLEEVPGLSVFSITPLLSIPSLTLLIFIISAVLIYLLKKIPFLCWIS